MKQRITPEQLQELTEEQKQKLREWWQPHFGDVLNSLNCDEVVFVYADGRGRLNFDSDGYEWDIKENCLPFLPIGKMIEILQSKDISLQDILFDVNYEHDIVPIYEGELCDALWQAVKAVL